MKYDFDRVIDRRNIHSMKWDVAENELPMWVADMDFEAAPEIMDTFRSRLERGTFGYTLIEDEWYDSYIGWWKRRHQFEMEKDWMMFITGVVPAISSIVRRFTHPNENVVIQTPVYNIFFNSIINAGARVLESELVYENGEYRIDFDDLEEKFANPQTTLMILCNPHNPVGKIWTKEELAKIGELAAKHHVVVVSDEIHCDLCDPGYEYVPYASVNDTCKYNSITCIAPTKAFNLAGIQTACIVVPDPFIRHQVSRGINNEELAEPNVFAAEAPVAAFNKGEQWLDELRAYLFENKKTCREYIGQRIPEIKVIDSCATYLLWLDCSALTDDATELRDFIRNATGLLLSEGEEYGQCGKAFLRLNTATCRERILDGLNRLEKGISLYKGGNKK